MGGIPTGPPLVANVVPQQERLQPVLRRLQIAHRIVATTAQISNGLVGDLRHVNGAQITAAHQARQRDRITAISLHAVSRLPRDQRGRHHVTAQAVAPEVSVQPVATRARFVDEYQRRAL